MASQLTQALDAATTRGDATATAYLKEQESTNFAQFLYSLCVELGSKDRPLHVRHQAGLIIKNALYNAQSEQTTNTLQQRWKALPVEAKTAVKGMMIQILADEQKDVRKTAALVVGKIAAVEIPEEKWNDLIPTLVKSITQQKENLGLKQSSLEALGYVCEEVPDNLGAQANLILGAIAAGMEPSEQNKDIKLAAVVCLVNAIDFIKTNMDNQNDRNTIMNLVFAVFSFPDYEVRLKAFTCLHTIADSYYKFLMPYMGLIFNHTTAAIKLAVESTQDSEAEVAQQAIEFWSTVAEIELAYMDEDADAGNPPPQGYQSSNLKFITAASPALVPFLLQALTKQQEKPDDDDWGINGAAGTCLGLCSQVAGDAIVPIVLAFIQKYIQDANWRMREASILAFGCILEGPNKEQLIVVVKQAFPLILSHMKDPHPLVKDTTAWTVGRICAVLPEVIDPQTLPNLMQTLVGGLAEAPKIASNVCWAIHNLASAVEIDTDGKSSPLSPFFTTTVQALLTASVRQDIHESHLQVSVYEALNIMIQSAAEDVYSLIAQVLPLIMKRLQDTLSQRVESTEEKASLSEVQALLCGSLQSIVTKLPEGQVMPHADNLMQLFLTVLQTKNSTVYEEALMAIAAVADKVQVNFSKYMEHVKPYLITGLNDLQNFRLMGVAVDLIAAITVAVGIAFAPWGDEIMRILLGHLQNANVERTIKSRIIATMGDIANAIRGHFERYLSFAVPMLCQAAVIKFDPSHPDTTDDDLDYVQDLRAAILTAFSGILMGLNEDGKIGGFVNHPQFLTAIHSLFDLIANDKHTTEEVLRDATGLIIDLVDKVGPQMGQALKRPAVQRIIDMAANDKEIDDGDCIKNGLTAKKLLSY